MGPVANLESDDSPCSELFFSHHHYYALHRFLDMFLAANFATIRTCSTLATNHKYQLELMDAYKFDAASHVKKDMSCIATKYLSLAMFYIGVPHNILKFLDEGREPLTNLELGVHNLDLVSVYNTDDIFSQYNEQLHEVFLKNSKSQYGRLPQ